MLTIYGVLRSRASRNVWMALELGVPFTNVPILPEYCVVHLEPRARPPHSGSADFLKINPNGTVPSLVDDDVVLHESMAINLYLARKHGGPIAGHTLAEEGLLTMWTLWAATNVESAAVDILHHRLTYPKRKKDENVAANAIKALHAPVRVLEAELAGRQWLVGDRFTVGDLNVSEVVKCASPASELFESPPHVRGWLVRCQNRPLYIETMRRGRWHRRHTSARPTRPRHLLTPQQAPALRSRQLPQLGHWWAIGKF